ncbi:MAG: ribosome-associated protein [Myxococcota bacterium]|jgi:ribosome-associated protein
MAKTKNTFSWVREDQDEEAYVPPDRRDGNVERAEKQVLKELAWRLVALDSQDRTRLPLDEELLEELDTLERQGPKSSRRRHLLRVQKLLREVDQVALEASIGRLDGPVAEDSTGKRQLRRLLAGGDEAIQTFLTHHPSADRQQLRTLSRKARGEGPAAEKARKRLREVIAEALTAEK